MKRRLLLLVGIFVPHMLCSNPPNSEAPLTTEASVVALLNRARSIDPASHAVDTVTAAKIDPSELAEFRFELLEMKKELRENKATDILAELNRDRARNETEEIQKEVDCLRWQNTLLTEPGGTFGLYKKDFIEMGLLAADTYADVKLYKELTRRRVEYILTDLFEETGQMIAMLKRVNASEARYQERIAQMTPVARMLTDQVRGRSVLLNPLRRYLAEHHKIVKGYNPFNSKTIVPLLARWGWEKVSAWLEDKLLVKPVWQDKDLTVTNLLTRPKVNEKLDAHLHAFQPNDVGHLDPVDYNDSPYSVSTGVKGLLFLLNPTRGFQMLSRIDTTNPWVSRLGFVNKVAGLGIPEFLLTDTTRIGLEVIGMGLAAKMYDKINASKWEWYVLKNREKLLRKLYAYRRALNHASSGEEALEKARKELREFVEKGHVSTSWIPGSALSEWWTMRDTARDNLQWWLGAGTVGLVGLKIAHWWYTMNQG